MDISTDTYDFTTILYWYNPNIPTVDERWVARYDQQEADDHALAVDATWQKIHNDVHYVAVVTGIYQNQYGHWDWATVKYDDVPASPKDPTWNIRYPQIAANSEEHDVPVDVTITTSLNNILAWVAGTFFRSQSGDDIGIVHYEEVP